MFGIDGSIALVNFSKSMPEFIPKIENKLELSIFSFFNFYNVNSYD